MLDFPEFPDFDEELAALVAAGGNSKAARSARAKLQLRDRYGRFIFMGRGLLKFKVRFSDGTVRSVLGSFVGARDPQTAQVYVSEDPSGLRTGFYDVKSSNVQEFVGQLSAKQLSDRGIKLGLDANGTLVKERLSEKIPDVDKIPFSDSPIGWNHKPARGGAEMWSTEDNDYNLYHSTTEVDGSPTETWGVENVNNNPGTVKNWRGVGFALKQVNELDSFGPEEDTLDTKERLPEGADVQPQDIADAQSESDLGEGELDLDTFGVAREGFLIPTGKSGQDTSPEGLAQFVEANSDYLKEGSGKRLVVDSDSGSVEIYTSADTLDNAKAQAGGIGAPEFHDLSTGETIPNDKGRVAGEPASQVKPEEREALETRLAKLNDQQANADGKQFERLEKQIVETEEKIAALDEAPEAEADAPEGEAPETDAPSKKIEPVDDMTEEERAGWDAYEKAREEADALAREQIIDADTRAQKNLDDKGENADSGDMEEADTARAGLKEQQKNDKAKEDKRLADLEKSVDDLKKELAGDPKETEKKEAPDAKDSDSDSGKSGTDDPGTAKAVDDPDQPEADTGSPAEPDSRGGDSGDSGGDKPTAAPADSGDDSDRRALERTLARNNKRLDNAKPEQLDQIEQDIADTQAKLDALDAPDGTSKESSPYTSEESPTDLGPDMFGKYNYQYGLNLSSDFVVAENGSGLPQVVTAEELKDAVDAGATPIYRMEGLSWNGSSDDDDEDGETGTPDTPEGRADALRTSEIAPFKPGDFGLGIYFGDNYEGVVSDYSDMDGNDYAVAAALPRDAKIIDMDELRTLALARMETFRAFESIPLDERPEVNWKSRDIQIDRAMSAQMGQGIGALASELGYDAIVAKQDDGSNYYIVVNRGKLIVSDSDARTTPAPEADTPADPAELDIPEDTNLDRFGNTPLEGWTKSTDANGSEVWTSPDGNIEATLLSIKGGNGQLSPRFVIKHKDGQMPGGTAYSWNSVQEHVDYTDTVKAERAAEKERLAAPKPDLAADLIKDFDSDGHIAEMIENGASKQEVLDELQKDASWAARLEDFNDSWQVDLRSQDQKDRWAEMEKTLKAINTLPDRPVVDDTLPEPDAPEASSPERAKVESRIADLKERLKTANGEYADDLDADLRIEEKRLADMDAAPDEPEVTPWDASGPTAAEAYDALPDMDLTPEVRESYFKLTDAIAAQYLEMKADGVEIQFGQDDPYGSSAEMLADVENNGTLKVFADGGATLPVGHPMKNVVTIDRKDFVVNDLFRAVHDYFGHVKSKERGATVGFGPKGEWEAWRTHRRTLPKDSWQALWLETRGQNTWTNYFGDNGSLPIPDRPFADQKAGPVDESLWGADLIGTETDVPDARRVGVFMVDEATLDDIRTDGGITVDVNTGERPEDGFIVSLEDHEFRVPLDDIDNPEKGLDTVNNYVDENREELDKPGNNLGVWKTEDGNEYALDVSEKVDDRDDAVRIGKERNQDAIFDVVNGESITLDEVDAGPNSEGSLAERKSRQDFPGLQDTNKPLNLNNDGEPTNSSAIYEIAEPSGDTDDRLDVDRIPSSSGTADSIDIPEDTPLDDYIASSERSGLTRSEEILQQSQEGQKLRDAAQTEIPYQDSDEDYADEKFMPTKEQRNIIRAVMSGMSAIVQALAGTGKTSTLELMARQLQKNDPDKDILYVAFNKTTQLEADGRMPKNVHSRTGDSLAYAGVDKKLTKKLSDRESLVLPKKVAQHLDIKNTKLDGEEHEDTEIARALGEAIDKFSISADDKIGPQHFEGLDIPHNEQTQAWAEEYWADLNSPTGKIKYTFNHNFKIWALSKPDLSQSVPGKGPGKADVIFFDEAQDINPVMAKIVRDQTIQKVYVGDARQSIYSFRGAINEMDNVEVDIDLPLTQSWRFGPEIAGFGNRFLSLLNSPLKVIGGGKKGEVMEPGSMNDPDAILTRSNAGALTSILEELEKGRVVGTSKKFKQDMQNLVQSVNTLRYGNGRVNHEDLQGYTTWDEVADDVANGKASAKVSMLYNIVNTMGMDQIKQAVGSIRETDGAGFGAGEAVKWTPGARGVLVDVPNKFGGMKPAMYDVEDAGGGDVTFKVSGNTFPIGDKFRAMGFKWNRDSKSWDKTGRPDSMADGITAMQNSDEAPIDVVVSTAHKAKGLEWNRVKIAADFRGPQEEVNERTGESEMTWPEPEEMRLAYVAVTRAQEALDPGSLAWAFDYTDESDENPDTPSRGIPGTENYDTATLPEAEEAPEAPEAPAAAEVVAPGDSEVEVPLETMSDGDLDNHANDVLNNGNSSPKEMADVRKELERREQIKADQPVETKPRDMSVEEIDAEIDLRTDTPEEDRSITDLEREDDLRMEKDRRERDAARAVRDTPEPEPTPDETPEPDAALEDEPVGDGMPDTTDELEDLAGRLEIEKSNETNPIRKKILQKQLDKIYEKYETLDSGGDADPDDTIPAPDEAPEAPTFTSEEHVASGNREKVVETLIEAKDITPERKQEIKDRINEGVTPAESAEIMQEVSSAPDRADIKTTPRPSEDLAENFTPTDPGLMAADDNPNNYTNADSVSDQLEFAHPNFIRKDNGDMIVQSREFGEKRYDTTIRRTSSNQFFTYITATDLKTGEVTATRLRENGQHSPKAVFKSLNYIKKGMSGIGDPEAFFKKQRYVKKDYLGTDGVLPDSAADELISGTDLPKSVHEADSQAIGAIVQMLMDNPEVTNLKALKAIGAKSSLDPKMIAKVFSAVKRRQKAEANYKLNPGKADKPSHISFDGTKLHAGDWVDWTDNSKTRPVKDADGNNIPLRDEDGNLVYNVTTGKPKVVTEPNPNYGRVYRGQVDHLLYEALNPAGYGYGDTTLSTFIEKNTENGLRNPESRSIPHVGSGLQKVSGPDAPESEPFFPPTRVIDHDLMEANGFGVPETGDKTVARPKKAAPTKAKAELNPATGKTEIEGFEGANVPSDSRDAAIRVENAEPKSARASELAPGDHITTLDKGNNVQYETVIRIQRKDNDRTQVTTASAGEDGSQTIKERDLGPETLTAFEDMDLSEFDDVIDPAAPATNAQIDTLRRLLDDKRLTRADFDMAQGVLGDLDATQADVEDMIRTISDIEEEAQTRENESPLAALFAQFGISTETLNLVEGRSEQDLADLRSGVDYGGEAVSFPDIAEVNKLEKIGRSTDQFERRYKLVRDMEVGDIIPLRGLGYLQTLGRKDDGTIRVRLLDAEDPYGAPISVDGVLRNTGEIFDYSPDKDQQFNVIVPSKANETYFAATPSRAQVEANARRRHRGGDDSPTLVADEPHFYENIKSESAAQIASLLEGSTPDGPAPEQGALHELGAFVKTADGQKLFVKRARGASKVGMGQAELAANRVMRAVGIDDVTMSMLPDGVTVASTTIPGKAAAQHYSVPRTGNRDADEGASISLWYKDIDKSFWEPGHENMPKIGLLDFLIGNPDRDQNLGNMMITPEGKHVPIDHGLLSLEPEFQKNVWQSPYTDRLLADLRAGRGNMTSAELLMVKGKLQAVFPDFVDMDQTAWYGTIMFRLNGLINSVNKGPQVIDSNELLEDDDEEPGLW